MSIQKIHKKKKRKHSQANSGKGPLGEAVEFQTMNQSQDVSHNIRMSMEEENKMREEQFDKPLVNESTDVIQNDEEDPASVENPNSVHCLLLICRLSQIKDIIPRKQRIRNLSFSKQLIRGECSTENIS